MSTQPEALRLVEISPYLEASERSSWNTQVCAELRRLFELAHEQHTEIYGLRAELRRLQHNNAVLMDALWKACGDDEEVVNATIESQGELK